MDHAGGAGHATPDLEVQMDLGTIVSVLMGLLAIAAVWAAIRVSGRSDAGRRAAPGYWIFALGAALQVTDLNKVEYSNALAIVATVAIVAGLAMIARGWGARSITS